MTSVDGTRSSRGPDHAPDGKQIEMALAEVTTLKDQLETMLERARISADHYDIRIIQINEILARTQCLLRSWGNEAGDLLIRLRNGDVSIEAAFERSLVMTKLGSDQVCALLEEYATVQAAPWVDGGLAAVLA